MENTYQTDDILIASFLLSQKVRYLDLLCDRPRHFIFVFEDNQICEQLAKEYMNNAPAPARELFARREELIGAIRYRNQNTYGKDY